MPTRVAATLLQGTFVAGGPGVGQLDDQLAKMLPGDPGEDSNAPMACGGEVRRSPSVVRPLRLASDMGITSVSAGRQGVGLEVRGFEPWLPPWE
jgi:hypothetical protein